MTGSTLGVPGIADGGDDVGMVEGGRERLLQLKAILAARVRSRKVPQATVQSDVYQILYTLCDVPMCEVAS